MAPKNGIILLSFLLLFASGHAFSEDKLSLGTVLIDPELDLDFYTHKLGDNWTYVRNGYKGENYSYSHSTGTLTNDWQTVGGETLFIDMSMKPFNNLSANLGFRLIDQYADSFWNPINIEHRLSVDGQSYIWDKADIKYGITKKVGLEYQRGEGHLSWKYRGDLFDLYPEQYDLDKYLNLSGHPVPDEAKLNIGTSGKGNLELIYGSEAIWNYKNGAYGNYSLNVLNQTLHLIYRDQEIFYGNPGERMQSAEASSGFKIFGNQLDLGVLFQPFRLNWDYVYVEDTAPGTGIGGSSYVKKTGVTNTNDAFGYSARFNLKKNNVLDMLFFQYTYDGIVAGNKQEVKTHLNRLITKQMTIGLDYVYRRPLIGPVPLVQQSVNGNLGAPLLQPRGPESPFWVGWGDPGTGDNREASIFSAIFTFNPTPNTWFYKYEPDNIADYNLNQKEKAIYSFAAVYKLADYPTSTDRLIYLDSQNNLFWDAPGMTGPSPTDGYIGEFTLLNRFNINNSFKAELRFSFGDSLATNSAAYQQTTTASKPITNYFISSLVMNMDPYSVKLEYDQDYWGPYLWQQQFGETFSKLYKIDLSRTFGQYVTISIGYIAARQPDDIIGSTELGDYDEAHMSVKLKFGPIKADFKERTTTAETIYGIMPNMNTTPPQVSLSLGSPSFSPGTGELLGINPLAVSVSDIYEWKITIKNSGGELVKSLSGQGQPPSLIEWNGLDDNKLVCRQDSYVIELQATDINGNSAASDPADVYLIRDIKAP